MLDQKRCPGIVTESLATFYLDRLDRFAHLRPDPHGLFNAEKLQRRAIYSTYLDCRALGLEQEARSILSQAEHDVVPS